MCDIRSTYHSSPGRVGTNSGMEHWTELLEWPINVTIAI